jgi:hypothetical protein
VGALGVGAPILGPPVPVGHASAGGSWPADVTPQQVAVDRGHHHAVGAGAPDITNTLTEDAASQITVQRARYPEHLERLTGR